MSNRTVIEARNLSKRYRLGAATRKGETFREFLVRSARDSWDTLRRGAGGGFDPRDVSEFWALKNISFDVKEGDVVGIIGPNGAGKTTLLKILSRITDPTEGIVRVRGRLSSLLEVGTGFHPELTGTENVYLNGAILGMRKAEIDAKFDEIVAFAEIERFLDTPVKRYSSGMYVRLAFAVAAHLDPDILVVDEVLAVGDIAFQKKCLGKMNEVSQGGRTVLFVSHNMAALENLCRSGIVLLQGNLAFGGSAKEAIDFYLHNVTGQGAPGQSHIVDLTAAVGRPAKCRPIMRRLELLTTDDRPANYPLPIGAPLKTRIHFYLDKPSSNVEASIAFDSLLGQRIFTAHSVFEPERSWVHSVGDQAFVCEIPSLTLFPGEYKLRLTLKVGEGEESVDIVEDVARLMIIQSDYYGSGKAPWKGLGTCVLKHRWHLTKS